MASRRRMGWPEKATISVGGLALIGALGAPLVGEMAKDDAAAPSSVTCLKLQEDYVAAVQSSPLQRERILPGADGRSYVLDDPQARYCQIEPEDIAAEAP
jgi:hypothetical protein